MKNHNDTIIEAIDNADEMLFVVAYVRENGVDIILDKIKNKTTKLLCSLDMGITQLSGIKKLLDNNVEVKIYKSNKGTFHPKIWLFGKKDTKWKMLIGSANLTRAAFIDNVEASVLVEEESSTSNALIFFNYLWDRENSSSISVEYVGLLQDKINERKAFKTKPKKIITEASKDDNEKMNVLFEYVKSWIDIPKFDSKGISALWRGWYVIPDQGYVSDVQVKNLKSYLPFIKQDVLLGENSQDENYTNLLVKFKNNSDFQRSNLKMSMHGLFTRQAKNYLIKFGWCLHPFKRNGKLDKKTLNLTDLGKQINQCDDLQCVKNLYTDYFLNCSHNGLAIVQFSKQLIKRLDYLTLDEFNYFIIHAYNDADLETIIDLIEIYRTLSYPDKFHNKFKSYFDEIKEPTSSNVYGNYTKSIKHTISVIGWCNGFYVSDDFTLKLNNAD